MGRNDSVGPVGKILRVDLSQKEWSLEEIPPDMIHAYIGGSGWLPESFLRRPGPQRIPSGPKMW